MGDDQHEAGDEHEGEQEHEVGDRYEASDKYVAENGYEAEVKQAAEDENEVAQVESEAVLENIPAVEEADCDGAGGGVGGLSARPRSFSPMFGRSRISGVAY